MISEQQKKYEQIIADKRQESEEKQYQSYLKIMEQDSQRFASYDHGYNLTRKDSGL